MKVSELFLVFNDISHDVNSQIYGRPSIASDIANQFCKNAEDFEVYIDHDSFSFDNPQPANDQPITGEPTKWRIQFKNYYVSEEIVIDVLKEYKTALGKVELVYGSHRTLDLNELN